MNIIDYIDDLPWVGGLGPADSTVSTSTSTSAKSVSYLQSPISSTSASTTPYFPTANPRMRNAHCNRNHTLASPLMEHKVFESPGPASGPRPKSKKRTSYGSDIFSYNVHKPSTVHPIPSIGGRCAKNGSLSPKSRLPLKPSVTIASIDTFADFQKQPPKRKPELGALIYEDDKKRKVSTASASSDTSVLSDVSSTSLFSHSSTTSEIEVPSLASFAPKTMACGFSTHNSSVAALATANPSSYASSGLTTTANSSLSLSLDYYGDHSVDSDLSFFPDSNRRDDAFFLSLDEKPSDNYFDSYNSFTSKALSEFVFED